MTVLRCYSIVCRYEKDSECVHGDSVTWELY